MMDMRREPDTMQRRVWELTSSAVGLALILGVVLAYATGPLAPVGAVVGLTLGAIIGQIYDRRTDTKRDEGRR